MTEPDSKTLQRFHRYFAIQCNNEFWALSERDLNAEEKRDLLTIAHASQYHWRQVGTDENIHLAYLAIARAYCVNESLLGVKFASLAFDFFDGTGEKWIQAFTNAVLSHAYYIAGDNKQCKMLYENAIRLESDLPEGDKKVFAETFKRIPIPRT